MYGNRVKAKPHPTEAFSLLPGKLDDIKNESNIDLINLTLFYFWRFFLFYSFISLGVSFGNQSL